MLMDDRQVSRYLASADAGTKLNTDDNGYLEYKTPFEFLDRTRTIIEALNPFAGWERQRVTGATAEDLAEIEQFYASRQAVLLDELTKPIE